MPERKDGNNLIIIELRKREQLTIGKSKSAQTGIFSVGLRKLEKSAQGKTISARSTPSRVHFI